MTMGGHGDHPITDILHYNLSVFSPRIDGLIKDIAKYLPEYRIDSILNWFSPPPLEELEIMLNEKLEELKMNAQKGGWET